MRPLSSPDAASSSDPVQIPNTNLAALGLALCVGDPIGVKHCTIHAATAGHDEEVWAGWSRTVWWVRAARCQPVLQFAFFRELDQDKLGSSVRDRTSDPASPDPQGVHLPVLCPFGPQCVQDLGLYTVGALSLGSRFQQVIRNFFDLDPHELANAQGCGLFGHKAETMQRAGRSRHRKRGERSLRCFKLMRRPEDLA